MPSFRFGGRPRAKQASRSIRMNRSMRTTPRGRVRRRGAVARRAFAVCAMPAPAVAGPAMRAPQTACVRRRDCRPPRSGRKPPATSIRARARPGPGRGGEHHPSIPIRRLRPLPKRTVRRVRRHHSAPRVR
ncbi:putative recombination regulator RecX [Burkholderia pseudomallei TSV44]|nr:putative recombination regulator RecX [Burkholderia pseudomallei TSV44]